MLHTVWGVVRAGKIEVIENAALAEGARVLVTVLPQEDEGQFWLHASQPALDAIWNNPQDDVYAQLVEK
jgi:hypothetical protein